MITIEHESRGKEFHRATMTRGPGSRPTSPSPRGKTANVLHVVADSDDELRDTLRGVLTSSDRARSEALTKMVTRRTLEQRTDTTPILAERIVKALRIDRPRVGAWGSASAVGSGVESGISSPPRTESGPKPPTR